MLADKKEPEPVVDSIPRLAAPLVTKLDWNLRSMTVSDLNGDGRNDLVVLNNDTGRIELLYLRKPGEKTETERPVRQDRWSPTLDDALFRRESISGDAAMLSLAVGDLNGDGLPDIVFTSERSALNVVFQGPEGKWTKRLKDKRHAPVSASDALAIVNLHDTPTLVALTKDGIAVYSFDKETTDSLPEPKIYRTANEKVRLVVADLLGNGKPVLGTFEPGVESVLRLRLPEGKGQFGPELSLQIPAASIDFSHPVISSDRWVALEPQQRRVNLLKLAADTRPLSGAEAAPLRGYPLDNAIESAGQLAVLDVNADGIDDLVVADPKGAELLVYRGKANGDFREPVSYPSLTGITAIVPVPGKAELLVLSQKEGVLGRVNFSSGKPSFPVPVATGDEKPLLLAATGGDNGMITVLTKGEKDKLTLQKLVFATEEKAEQSAVPTFEKLFEVENSRRDLIALQLVDFSGDGRIDVAAFVDREAMRFWVQDEKGSFAEVAKDSAFRKSMLDSVTPAEVSFAPVDKSGKLALLVANQGLVRALSLNTQNELEVLFQANLSGTGKKLKAPLLGDFSGQESPVLLVYNETDKTLEWLERDDDGVFRSKQQIPMEGFSPLLAWLQQVGAESTPRLVYLTKEKIIQVPTAHRGLQATLDPIYDADLEQFIPMVAVVGQLSAGDSRSILLFDRRNYVLEVIHPNKEGEWTSALHFVLFDENPHYRGRRSAEMQPRDCLIADVTGDGKKDVILQMHDRVLVYPQH